jgi:MurNAc alpha-1-phosphate uridylyltransferase
MPYRPDRAMILAAGRGSRMRELTNTMPKPLVEVSGKALIDHVLQRVIDANIKKCIVNLCYKGDMIRSHLMKQDDIEIVFSKEEKALNTGGGVKNALSLLGDKPFYVLNSDPIWTEPTSPVLNQLSSAFDPAQMDVIIMLQPIDKTHGHDGDGDYYIENMNPRRKKQGEKGAPFIYAGAQIISPSVFDAIEEDEFSLVKIFDIAEKKGRLGCIVHDGQWFHVGTPEAVAIASSNVA